MFQPSERELRGSVLRATLAHWKWIVPVSLVGLFAAELFVMYLLDLLRVPPGPGSWFLDAALLTALVLPGFYLAVLRPVGRLAAELTMASANARFRAVVEATGDTVIVGDRDGRIRYVNRAGLQMLGYAPGELEGQEVAVIVPEEQRDSHRAGMKRYFETGEARVINHGPVKLEARTRNGDRIPIELSLSEPTSHREGLLVAVIRDLRQTRRLGLYEALLPVCCVCGQIRDDEGAEGGAASWGSLEDYVRRHAAAQFSHGLCPRCAADYRRREGLPDAAGRRAG